MAPSSANGAQPVDPDLQPGNPRPPQAQPSGTEVQPGATEPAGTGPAGTELADAALGTAELLELLGADRLWLLQQIDAGHWPELRLDLAALERELGQLLDQASERLTRR